MLGLILRLANSATLTSRHGGRGMYDALSREYYWQNISVDILNTVRYYQNCLNSRTEFRH